MTLMNAHSLFLGSRQVPAFHQAISPCPKTHEILANADKKARGTLRATAEKVAASSERLIALTTRQYFKDHGRPEFDVRFLWQGSKVYKTDIDPAQKPPQQTDLDDGVYLRTSFFSQTDPAIASERFFTFVEAALQPLCNREGWTLVTDKNTCVRIEIGNDKHLDFPLYAIPDEEFLSLEAAACRTFGVNFSNRDSKVLAMFDREGSLRIDPKRVMLAHREKGWIASDPRALHDWFEAKVEEFGPQLKRMCRYLKGWRDYVFLRGGPESITLMVCVVMVYEKLAHKVQEDRDDEAFLIVTKELPALFRSDILNPVLEGQNVKLNNWGEIDLALYIKKAEWLNQKAETALNGTANASITVDRFIEALGDRFPERPDLVKVEMETKSALASPAIGGASSVAAAIKPAQATTSG